jgi:hypothetical protein
VEEVAVVGKLRRLPLREVWRHEALDFTRWLEEEVDVLGEAIGLELTAAERERAAGDFSVDLIAEDDAGRLVVIENQLERSNHDHLGKLITYMSVLEAGVAIWIVASPRPEHVTAVTWLNESRGAEFYLLKAEAVAIGNSDPAPLLTLIVGPSEETHEVGDTKRELAGRHAVRHRFWSELLEAAKSRTKLHSAISPGKENWIGTGAGVSGLSFNYVITRHGARIELYLDRGDEALNQQTYEHFESRREAIEASFGGPLDWQPLSGRRACRINVEVAQVGYADEAEWPELQAKMIEAMVRFETALRPAIADLR